MVGAAHERAQKLAATTWECWMAFIGLLVWMEDAWARGKYDFSSSHAATFASLASSLTLGLLMGNTGVSDRRAVGEGTFCRILPAEPSNYCPFWSATQKVVLCSLKNNNSKKWNISPNLYTPQQLYPCFPFQWGLVKTVALRAMGNLKE